jgi:hypothetical protein
MEIQEIIMTAMVFLISIIGFFLKRVIDEHDRTKDIAIKNQANIDLINSESRLKYEHLESKINDLTVMVKELATELRNISIQLSKKKDLER